MEKKVKMLLSESNAARWTVLVFVSFTMMCAYFLADAMAPLKSLMEMPVEMGGLGWTSGQYGLFTSTYGWFNVFLFMLIIGGIILDKVGVRIAGTLAILVMLGGIGLKYWAVTTSFATPALSIFGFEIGKQLLWASVGFALFGVGIEIIGITVTKLLVKWFKNKEIALALGLEMAVSRIGTGLALGLSPLIVDSNDGSSIGRPLLLGLLLLVLALMSFIVFCVMDVRRDREVAAANMQSDEDKFRISDIFSIIKIRGFWYIAILCVLFYSAVFPFLKYAADLMSNKFGISEELSGIIPSLLPFGTMLLTPLFGGMYDKRGRGADIMILGAVLLIVVHVIFSIPVLNNWLVALVAMIVLGIGFSLVPSAMWPSVPKIIPERQLGTAYAVIFWIQNWGLMGVPLLIGYVLEKYCVVEEAGKISYDYTLPMMIFTAFGVLALGFALLLRREDAKKGFGLQKPNIKQD